MHIHTQSTACVYRSTSLQVGTGFASQYGIYSGKQALIVLTLWKAEVLKVLDSTGNETAGVVTLHEWLQVVAVANYEPG